MLVVWWFLCNSRITWCVWCDMVALGTTFSSLFHLYGIVWYTDIKGHETSFVERGFVMASLGPSAFSAVACRWLAAYRHVFFGAIRGPPGLAGRYILYSNHGSWFSNLCCYDIDTFLVRTFVSFRIVMIPRWMHVAQALALQLGHWKYKMENTVPHCCSRFWCLVKDIDVFVNYFATKSLRVKLKHQPDRAYFNSTVVSLVRQHTSCSLKKLWKYENTLIFRIGLVLYHVPLVQS